MIEAKIIADSLSPSGDRCTSLLCTFPRFILAELNTHRAFSRNSASSRAVPFETMLKRVEDDPFIPIKWMKDHKGMQGKEYFEDVEDLKSNWINASRSAIHYSKNISSLGLTKQICNRLLEPFMWHTAIVTATDFENFFSLRCEDGAEIHFQDLAYKILNALNEGNPKRLNVGDWHIPFGDKIREDVSDSDKLKIATARCARLSYINYEGKDDYEADFRIYEKLLKDRHMSPFEHCAIVEPGQHGNFKGFKQLRKFIDNENRSDLRLIKKI